MIRTLAARAPKPQTDDPFSGLRLFRGKGCAQCQGSGACPLLSRAIASEQDMVIDLQNLSKLLGPFLPDRPLAVFHLGDVALGNPSQAC